MADRLLDFHLEHDPDGRTVTVTTLVDRDGEMYRYTTTGIYLTAGGPELAYAATYPMSGVGIVGGPLDRVSLATHTSKVTLTVGMDQGDSRVEPVPPTYCRRCQKLTEGRPCPDHPAAGWDLARRGAPTA